MIKYFDQLTFVGEKILEERFEKWKSWEEVGLVW